MSGYMKDKLAALIAPMANAYGNAVVFNKIKNLVVTFRHRKSTKTSSRFLPVNTKGKNKIYPTPIVLRLPRPGYYRYLFGFRIMPLGSWPLSSSYAVFYFCRKSLTGLEGAGVGVMTQVPSLRCFPRLEKQDLDCSLYFHSTFAMSVYQVFPVSCSS
ncbi:hypothetical protein DY000_02052438 [Brassica cretica]|uniref:Uncharacterized protein n=1 Tax=Brassica cretica TaxID=69181 RepID=A0ABQ7AG74_BRACR|nr:hypothetical protein DY000_02052438 [Brassica cretica]